MTESQSSLYLKLNQNGMHNILSFLPDILLQHIFQSGSNKIIPPERQSFSSLLLMINIGKFSSFFNKNGSADSPESLESLSLMLKIFYECFQDHIGKTGGDILRFQTDKVLAIWPIPLKPDEEGLTKLCKCTLQSIFNFMINFLNNFQAQFPQCQLKPILKIYLTIGDLNIFHLGGKAGMYEYTPSGQAMNEILRMESVSPSGPSILINSAIAKRIIDNFRIESINNFNEYYTVKAVIKPIDNLPITDPSYLKKSITAAQFEQLKGKILGYVPNNLIQYISNKQDTWLEERRRLPILYQLIAFTINDIKTEAEISKLNTIIARIQAILIHHRGRIYRIFFTERGLVLIGVFGLYPNSHQEDSIRCVLAGSAINKDMLKYRIPSYIGISTGECLFTLCGIYRKEQFILGEPIHTAYLLNLFCFADRDCKGALIVDNETMLDSQSKITYKRYISAKGQSSLMRGRLNSYGGLTVDCDQLYEPITTSKDDYLAPMNSNNFPELRTHMNNTLYMNNITNEEYYESMFMIGRNLELQKSCELIINYLHNPIKANFFLIAGQYGVGKSLFCRNLLEEVWQYIKKNDFSSVQNDQEKPTIIVSSLNGINRMQKMNGWICVIRQILLRLSIRYKLKKETIIEYILAKTPHLLSNISLVKDILGLEIDQINQSFSYDSRMSARREIEVPTYEQKPIIKIILAILREFIGENIDNENNDELILNTSTGRMSERTKPDNNTSPKIERKDFPPLIICLDDLQYHDELCWKLANKICKKLQKIFIIGLLRIDELESTPEKTNIVEEGILSLGLENQNVNKIMIEPLNQKQLNSLLIKTANNQQISSNILNYIYQKSRGIPLIAIQTLFTLENEGLLMENNNDIRPTERMSQFLRLNEYLEIPAPTAIYKIHTPKMDKLTMQNYLLLKVASTIGDKFDLKTLYLINPLKFLSHENIISSLMDLTRLEYIDIVQKQNDNIIYIFGPNYLREVLYQKIPITLRKILHRQIAESMQNLPVFSQNPELTNQVFNKLINNNNNDNSSTNESKRIPNKSEQARTLDKPIKNEPINNSLEPINNNDSNERVNYQMILAAQGFSSNKQNAQDDDYISLGKFPNQVKRESIFKALNSQLYSKKPTDDIIIRANIIEKKTHKANAKNRWPSKFLVLTLASLKYYQSEQDYKVNKEFCTCSILLQYIMDIQTFTENDRIGLVILTSQYVKPTHQNNTQREFYFAFQTVEEAEIWYIFLQYARTRVIYESFIGDFSTNLNKFYANKQKSSIDKISPEKEKVTLNPIDETNLSSSPNRLFLENSRQGIPQSQFQPQQQQQQQQGRRKTIIKDYSKPENIRDRSLENSIIHPSTNRDYSPGQMNNQKLFPEMLFTPQNKNFDEERRYEQDSTKKLDFLQKKKLVENFLGKSQILFWSHVITAPTIPLTTGIKPLGVNTSLIKKRPDIMKIDPELLETMKNILKGDQDQHNRFSRLDSIQSLPLSQRMSIGDNEQSKLQQSGFYSSSGDKFEFNPQKSPREKKSNRESIEIDENIFKKSLASLIQTHSDPNDDENLDISRDRCFTFKPIPIIKNNDNENVKSAILHQNNQGTPKQIDNNRPVVEKLNNDEQATIEKVVKGRRAYPKNNEKKIGELDIFGLKKPKEKTQKALRQLDKPNIYGKFEFFPGFFFDSLYDDKIVHSYSNKISYQSKLNSSNLSKKLFDDQLKERKLLHSRRDLDTYTMQEMANREGKSSSFIPKEGHHKLLEEEVLPLSPQEEILSFNWSALSPQLLTNPSIKPNNDFNRNDHEMPSYENIKSSPIKNLFSSKGPSLNNTMATTNDSPTIRLRNSDNSSTNSLRKPENELQQTSLKNNYGHGNSLINLQKVQPSTTEVNLPYPFKKEEISYNVDNSDQASNLSFQSNNSINMASINPKNLPLQNYFFGRAIRDTRSQDGNIFQIPKDDFMVITRIYEKKMLVECLYKGLIGIFPLPDIQVFSSAQLYEDANGNLKVKSYNSYTSDNYQSQISDTSSLYRNINNNSEDYSQKWDLTPNKSDNIYFQKPPNNLPIMQSLETQDKYHGNDKNNFYSFNHKNDQNNFKEDSILTIDSNLSQSSSGSKKPLKMLKRQQKKFDQYKGNNYKIGSDSLLDEIEDN